MPVQKANGAIPLTHIGFVLPFVAYLEDVGVPVEKYLRRAKIPPALLQRPDAWIPLHLGHRFLDEACRVSGIEDPGMHVGRRTSLSDLGEFGQRLLGARNVLDYLERGVHLISSVTSTDRYRLRREGDWVRFIHRQEGPGISEQDKQHSHLFTLTVTIGTLRRVAGADWCPREVTLPSLGTHAFTELSAWLPDTRVITGSRAASFLFPASLLALPMAQSRDAMTAPGTSSISASVPTEFLASARLLVESLLTAGYPEMSTVAEAAGLSVRSFRRRLAECGTTYSAVVARTRITLAEQWLAGGDRSVTEIALALGYTDRSNFTRAFRRAYGVSPRTYRDRANKRISELETGQ